MSSPFAGGKVGRYKIIGQLGHGMSMVFKAVNLETDREAALKLVHLDKSDGREIAEAERRGATLQARLCGEGAPVPEIYDYGEANGYFYVAMEFIEGEDLTTLIGRGALDTRRATSIAIDVCEFLEKAHAFVGAIDGKQAQGIVHGDLKPGNIRIARDGRAVILDLGIAKALSGKSTKNDYASIAYSSPERLKTGKMNSLSDLWSVGVVLYEMVVGARPFNAEDTRSLEREIKSGRLIEFPSDYDLPPTLRKILTKALAPNPEKRYATANSFKDDLQRFQRGARTRAEQDDESDYELPTERFEEPPTQRTDAPRMNSQTAWDEPDSEATRKTVQPSVAATPQDMETKPLERISSSPTSRLVRRVVIALVILSVLGLVANELLVLSAATQLKNELASEQLRNMDEAWTRFDALKGRSLLRFGISPARQPLKEKLIAQADWVFKDYRNNGSPAVREKNWQDAQRHLSRALEIEADNSTKSRLRYSEGHVHRINGMAKLDSNAQEAKKAFNNAMNLFVEATALNGQWADPHLGLASVFAYGLHDPAKVASELEQLKRLNADPGTRGAAMLADAYWANANDMHSKAGTVSNCNQKIEIYERAREGYAQAIELYKPIITFGNSARNLNHSQTRINRIDQLLEPLRERCYQQQ
ncbi:MAG: serine/threonine-protein kinase [Acidobacteriota bacterium]